MICISITAKKTKEALQDISIANKIADVIEIRTDYLSDLDLPILLKSAKKPVIITHRKYDEGGFLQTHENERLEILKSAIKLRAEFIDIEYTPGNEIINELKKLKRKTKIILSYHNFKETPTNLEVIYSKLNKINCDIVKIVTYANSINDNLRIFEFLEGKKNLITFCMGEYGQLSRILAIKYGSLLTYSSLSYGKESAEGQLTGEMLKEIYHVHKNLLLQFLLQELFF
jgi:3-dehydroquinate dehydratase/shikimate dehydrogenase